MSKIKQRVIMKSKEYINKTVSIMAEHCIFFESNYYEDLLSPFVKGVASFKIDDVIYCSGHVMSDFSLGNEIYSYPTSVRFNPDEEKCEGSIEPIFNKLTDYKYPFGKVIYNNYSGVLISVEDTKSNDYLNVPIANEILTGDAELLMRDENGEIQEYSITIIDESYGNKDTFLLITSTDERFLKKTNGFVLGISGSPIIQNNKLIGVVYGAKKNIQIGVLRVIWNTSCIQGYIKSL